MSITETAPDKITIRTPGTCGMTAEEVTESVTGFDEIAVHAHMGMDIYMDAEAKPIGLMRSLAFVYLRHNGKTDTDAKSEAMGMPLKVLQAFFDKDEELDPDEPETDSGKDGSTPESERPESPSSASPQA